MWNAFFIINLILAGGIVFFSHKDVQTIWAWLLVLYFLPVVGLILYFIFGQDIGRRYRFQMKLKMDESHVFVDDDMEKTENLQRIVLQEQMAEFSNLATYNFEVGGSVITADNDVTIITDGQEKFERLFDAIRNAKRYIHLQYYIFHKGKLLGEMFELLREKVKEGVEVRVLYDSLGSRGIKRKDWQRYREWGIQTGDFFPAHFGRLQGRVNYRNHRKVVVIDGEVAFVGGFNVGQEYLSQDRYFGYWRDTHLMLRGGSVAALQTCFALDWNFATKENLFLQAKYFTCTAGKNRSPVQIIRSGPDQNQNVRLIRDNYLYLIQHAKFTVCIQTPYFIPDELILQALVMVAHSGVDVRIMLPGRPDHLFVYRASYSYLRDLLQAGVHCYLYEKGFLHAKGVISDETAICFGTANMDIRSFQLNFEVNAIVYDEAVARQMHQIFLKDVESCHEITLNEYDSRSIPDRIRERLSRLLSPIL